jgi:hypothetical protein
MKNTIILGLAVAALSACTSTGGFKIVDGGQAKVGLSVIKDDENNTICHVYKDDDFKTVSMTCMKQDPFKNINVKATFSNTND